MEIEEQFLDTWNIHSRINLYLLDAIQTEALAVVPAGSRTHSIGRIFAHVHAARLMWLEVAAPALMKGLAKIGSEKAPDKKLLHRSLQVSGRAIASLLEQAFETGKIKGFKPHPVAFVGYIVSHESYHHGEICMALTQAGYPLDKKVAYGMWEWGRR